MSSLDEVEIKVENFAIDIADYERCYHEEGPSGAMLDRRAGLTNYWSQIKFELAANGLNAMILSPNIRDHKSGSADGNSDGYYPQDGSAIDYILNYVRPADIDSHEKLRNAIEVEIEQYPATDPPQFARPTPAREDMETLRIPGKGKGLPLNDAIVMAVVDLAYENLQRPAEVLILDTLYHECTLRKVDLNGVKELICIKHKSWGHWLTLRMLIDDHTIECYDPNSGRLDHKACDELRDDFLEAKQAVKEDEGNSPWTYTNPPVL